MLGSEHGLGLACGNLFAAAALSKCVVVYASRIGTFKAQWNQRANFGCLSQVSCLKFLQYAHSLQFVSHILACQLDMFDSNIFAQKIIVDKS